MDLEFPPVEIPVLWALVAPVEAERCLRRPPGEWLAPAEQEALAGFHFEGRQREWCAGRLAVKRAVQRWLEETRGVRFSPAEVEVYQDGGGAPHVTVPAGYQAPPVSIAHTDGRGFAALVPPQPGVRVGVDLERLRDLNPRLVERLLGPGETGTATVQPPGAQPLDGVTLWTLKEATLKALGVGLRLPMRCLTIECLTPGRARIHRAPGPPDVDDFDTSPWIATGVYSRCDGFSAAIVIVKREGGLRP